MTTTGAIDRLLSDRVVARAVILAIDPVLEIEGRAETLLRIAKGSRQALEHALRRIEWGQLDRPSRYAAAASETIRAALRRLETAGTTWTMTGEQLRR